jgi:hypothetical protein
MPTETRSPTQTTTIVAGWSNPTYAYSSNDQRTDTGTDQAEQEYSGYGFSVPSGAVINKIEVGIEGYCTSPGVDLLTVKTWDGSSWFSLDATANYGPPDVTQWLDFTNKTTWTPQKVNQVKTRILYKQQAGGDSCYPDKTFLLCIDDDDNYAVKRCSEVKAGDMVLGYRKDQGYQRCHVVNVEKHEGTFDILKITIDKSPVIRNVDVAKVQGVNKWKEYIYVTPNHEVCSPTHGGRVKCELLKVGDLLTDLHLGQMIHVPVTSIEETAFRGTVYNVRLAPHYEGFFYFIVSLDDEHIQVLETLLGKGWNLFKNVEFALFGLGIKSWLVDWLPVRVTYTEAIQAGHSTKMSMTKTGA